MNPTMAKRIIAETIDITTIIPVLRRVFELGRGSSGGVDVGGGVGAGVVDVAIDELDFCVEDTMSDVEVGLVLVLAIVLLGETLVDTFGTMVVVTGTVSTAFLFNEKVLGGASVPLSETNVTPTGESTPLPFTGASTRRAWHATGKDRSAGASEEMM